MKKKSLLLLLLILPLFIAPRWVAAESVNAELIAEDVTLQPGHPSWFVVRLQMDKGWHTYWSNPGEVGLPTEIDWTVPEGFKVGNAIWPVPNQFDSSGLVGFGYKEEALWLVEITPPGNLTPGQSVEIKAEVSWLACSDECVPGGQEISTTLVVAVDPPKRNPATTELFAIARRGLPQQLILTSVDVRKNALDIVWADETAKVIGVSAEAYFFPALEMPVDIQSSQMLTMAGDDDFTYRLQVPLSGDLDQVRGLLVVSDVEKGERTAYEVDVPVAMIAATAQTSPDLLWVMVFAFFGGLVLNVMPCVFPVISLKVLSFVKMAGKDQRKTFAHGLIFSAGILVSLWALVALLFAVRASGTMAGWGFQMQDPRFLMVLVVVLFLVGLNFFGVFEVGTGIAGAAGQAQSRREGFIGSFLSGVLATAVATPCTGAFMAPALGAAMALPYEQAFLIFTLLGLGLCSPYILLAAVPQLLRFLPKPGAWMITFKQAMGFLMMLSVLWLLWNLERHVKGAALIQILGMLVLVAVAAWIFGRWGSAVSRAGVRRVARVVALGLIVLSFFVGLRAAEQDRWVPFSEKRLEQLRSERKAVFIDYTARWCLVCQFNKLALYNRKVQRKFDQLGVVTMVADWTRSDPEITRSLEKHGRVGVPLYVLYGNDPSSEPVILPQTLTPDVVLSYLSELE